MALSASTFRRHLLRAGVLEPKGTHHEFASGLHGQKLDFDTIPEWTGLYAEWVDINATTIQRRLGWLPLRAVLGVANGTNRLARDCAARLGTTALFTQKISSNVVALTEESRQLLGGSGGESGVVVVLEDVGTSGGTALTALASARIAGVTQLEAQFTWQRTGNLEAFEAAGAPYHSIITEPLPAYTPEQCLLEGFCKQGWRLIEHD